MLWSIYTGRQNIMSNAEELELPRNHLKTEIAGLTGKGDLSNKPHIVALNPKLQIDTGLAFRYGQKKHGVNNFRTMTQEASQGVMDALLRHLNAYLNGETHTDDSKLHHLAHVSANLNMLYRLIERHGDKEVLKNISGGDINV